MALSSADLALIRLLQADGRASYRDLAAKLGLAERTVSHRIAELRDKAAIEISIVADPRRLGYSSMAMLGVAAGPDAGAGQLAERLLAISGIDYTVTAGGRYDILAEAVALDDVELGHIIDELRRHPDVFRVETFPYLRLHYQQLFWDAAQSKAAPTPPVTPPALDETDLGIIAELSADGRASFLDISRRLSVSESHIRTRYARLVDSGLIRVLALTNPHLLGYHTNAWIFLNASGQEPLSGIADWVSQLPHVTYVAICAGRFDLMAEVICSDKEELLALTDNEIRKHSAISRAEILMCYDLFYRKVPYGLKAFSGRAVPQAPLVQVI